MILLISVAFCSADFVAAFQPPSSVQHPSRARQHIRSSRIGGSGTGYGAFRDVGACCRSSFPKQSNDGLDMLPSADIVEHAADFSANTNAGTKCMLLALSASSLATTSTTTLISALDVNDLLYKAQSMASDMVSSTGIFGGSASGLSEGGVGVGAGASGGITATSWPFCTVLACSRPSAPAV